MKEQFYTLIKSKGFKSFREFCRAAEIGPGNAYTNIDGTFKLSMDRAFTFARVLEVPIDTILAIFYPDEMKALEKFS